MTCQETATRSRNSLAAMEVIREVGCLQNQSSYVIYLTVNLLSELKLKR